MKTGTQCARRPARRRARACGYACGFACGLFGLLSAIPVALADESGFEADAGRAQASVEKVMPAWEEKLRTGDFTGANETLLSAFPAAARTPAESFLLGNALYDFDPKESYALHQAAAKAEPRHQLVIWEWALEQHRAREYAGALASYQAYSKMRPGQALSYAMQADCLLRLDRVDEASEAWHKSEEAPQGTREGMEELVCAVHRELAPHRRRAELLARATRQKDADAAAELIALDCDFPKDWWNGGPVEQYLSHDLPAVEAALGLPADDVRRRAMSGAADCATAQGAAQKVTESLARHRLLTDADHTLPDHAGLLSVIVAAVANSNAIDEEVLHKQIGPRALERAKKSHDARLWNVAAFLAIPEQPEEQIRFERDALQATGDARFAGAVLYVKLARGQLAGSDPDLAAALRQFPENGLVWRAAYEVAAKGKKVTKELLANAARAEFTHFSSFVAPATVVNRPRSDYLRSYFAQMRKLSAATRPADKG